MKLNLEVQYYKGLPLRLIDRKTYQYDKAKRFMIGNIVKQNVWIPNKHLESDGTLKQGENIDYILKKEYWKVLLAGYTYDDGNYKRK